MEEYRGPKVLVEASEEGQRDAECEQLGKTQRDDVNGGEECCGHDDRTGWSEML